MGEVVSVHFNVKRERTIKEGTGKQDERLFSHPDFLLRSCTFVLYVKINIYLVRDASNGHENK